jgi:predicted nucleic acid-binding Zn ribbon protein
MRNSNDLPLKDVIEEFVNAYRLNDKLNEVEINNLWNKISGKIIAKHTKQIVIKGKTLYIELDSAALKQELSFSKTKIISNINEKIGTNLIEEIVFL